MKAMFRFMIVTMCVALLLGCGSGVKQNYTYGGPVVTGGGGLFRTSAIASNVVRTYPPTNPNNVLVTSQGAPGPYDTIGEVRATFNQFHTPHPDELARPLQIKAAQLGADMVINFKFSNVPIMNIGSASGLAIKLRR